MCHPMKSGTTKSNPWKNLLDKNIRMAYCRLRLTREIPPALC